MPKRTILEMPSEEQTQMLAALRCARYGSLLGLHILLLGAVGRHPTEIANVLFCSRSSVYRTLRAYRAGTLGLAPDEGGRLIPRSRTTVLVPTRRRSLVALLKAAPQAYGWCRTRWSCATLAATLQTTRGITVSAETLRRWVHEVGWVWKRAKLAAKDDDPQRGDRLARLRYVFEHLTWGEALVCWLPTSCPRATRSSAPSAMCMTAARGTIGANAYQSWWPMSKTICTAMAPGHPSGQTSTLRRRSPQQLRKSLLRHMQQLLPVCTNLVWIDLVMRNPIQSHSSLIGL